MSWETFCAEKSVGLWFHFCFGFVALLVFLVRSGCEDCFGMDANVFMTIYLLCSIYLLFVMFEVFVICAILFVIEIF